MDLGRLAPVFLAASLVASPGPGDDGASPAASTRGGGGASETVDAGSRGSGRFLVDVGVAAAGGLLVAVGKPDIRHALARDARLANVVDNFAHPIRQVRLGTRRDQDPALVNYLAHPGLFALEALYLKRRGYRDGTAFAFTQVHSVMWEFAIEGAAFEPSGKDLLTDAGGAALAIWILRPVAEKASRRIDRGQGRWWDHLLRWIDPVAAATGSTKDPRIAIRPSLDRGSVRLELAGAF